MVGEDLSVDEARHSAARLLARIDGHQDWPLRWADECLPQGWYLEGIDGHEFDPLTIEHLTCVILGHAMRDDYRCT